MKQYINVNEAAELAGVSVSTIRRMEARGDLTSKRFGRSVRIHIQGLRPDADVSVAGYIRGAS